MVRSIIREMGWMEWERGRQVGRHKNIFDQISVIRNISRLINDIPIQVHHPF